MYYTYMLRCEDNSLYTGMTSDLNRRMSEHFNRTKKCAKYIMTHKAKKLENAWKSNNRVLASKLEFYIKKLSKDDKESLALNEKKLEIVLNGTVDTSQYIRVIIEKNK